jgi:hypothetical protein
LSHIISLVQQAQKNLMSVDRSLMFPNVHNPMVWSINEFQGAPLDCAVDFGIRDTNLVTVVTCIVLPDVNPLEHALSQLKQAQTIMLNGKEVQIVERIEVETCLPCLVELKDGLGRIEALCSDFIRKYNALW